MKAINKTENSTADAYKITLARRFAALSHSLQEADGWKLYQDKDVVHWINPKTKQGSKAINYYAFNKKDFSQLNKKLNELSIRENRMKSQGYDLNGVKSFNRNIWLDLCRNSNAIEGIFDDFAFDLMDFRTKLRGQIAIDPSTENFDRFEYFKKLLNQYKIAQLNNDNFVVQGTKKPHYLSMDMIRHFLAFKYVYKCGKLDRKADKYTKEDFVDLIPYTSALLSGQELVPFRRDQVYINSVDGIQAKWAPVSAKDIYTKLDALGEWFASPEGAAKLHPIEAAAIFHAEFVRIHPYMDGNGRTARIMTNYILIKNEIPTISIRHKKSDEYFIAENKAIETHEIDDLIDIFCREIWDSANKIEECLDYQEKLQKYKVQDKTK